MRRVIVESPYAGDVEENVRYARRCLFDCLWRGEAPLASHLLYTQVLRDENETHRTLGMEAGWAWQHAADALVVYRDRGVSSGMRQAIARAEELGVPIEYRSLQSHQPVQSDHPTPVDQFPRNA